MNVRQTIERARMLREQARLARANAEQAAAVAQQMWARAHDALAARRVARRGARTTTQALARPPWDDERMA